MVRQTTKVIILEILGAISLVLMGLVAILAIMLIRGPVDISMFKGEVVSAIADSRNGRPVSIDGLTLQWSPSERRLFVVADDLSFKDEAGRETGAVKEARLTLDAGALLRREVIVIDASMEEGWLELRHIGPGQWTLIGDPLPEIPEGILPQTPREWLDRVNEVLNSVLVGLEATHEDFQLERLSFEQMDIRIIETDETEIARLEKMQAELERAQKDIYIALSGSGTGMGLPGGFGVTLSTSEAYERVNADVSINDLPFSELTTRLGVPALAQGDLVVDITTGATSSKTGGLERINMQLDHTSGTLGLPQIDDTLSDLTVDAVYSPASDSVQFNTLAIRSQRVDSVFSGELSNVLAENALRRISLDAAAIDVDLTPRFPTGWQFSDFELRADLSDDFRIAVVDILRMRIDDAVIQASGEADFTVEPQPGELPLNLDINAEIIGELSKQRVLGFWPETLGDGARRFVVSNIGDIMVTEASASLALRPDSLAEGFLRDGDLGVSFAFADGSVKFMSDFPPVENAIGTGRVSGNSFGINVLSATYDDWQIDLGAIDFPAFNPRGQSFTITAEGEGPASSILRQLGDSRLQLEEQTGLDPERVTGTTRASLKLVRPALSNVPIEDVQLEATATIREGGLKDAALGLDLTDATVQVNATLERLIITGFGELGEIPVQFTTRDTFNDNSSGADISASAIVTPDLLNAFGFFGRAYLTGEIPVEMQGTLARTGLDQARFGFDLRDARIDVEEFGWIKPAGDIARATLIYRGGESESATSVRLESETAEIDGDIALGDDGRLQSLLLRRLFIDGRTDVTGQVTRRNDETVVFQLNGDFLDVTPFMQGFGGLGDTSEIVSLPIELDAEVKRLRLRRGLELENARLTYKSSRERLELVDARGTSADGSQLNARYVDIGDGQGPEVELISGDAGFMAEAFLDLDFITGGSLNLRGRLASETDPARLQVSIRDARLRDAPFVTQVLSLASLRGLTDTLSGEGVLFTEIEAPITIGGGRYIVRGGRASGPALGLTVNGSLATDGSAINLDGVLVPSFGVNSMLGGVPVIGDLFVGREGEGIFSIAYSVRGSLEKAQVAVNPLSAVTPGILRRIFENPADTTIPESLPVDPNLKPPVPKLPELPEDEVLGDTPG